MFNLSIIVSSTRPQRIGSRVASWVINNLEQQARITVLDLAEIDLPFLDEDMPAGSGVYAKPHTLAWKSAIDGSDAILVVTPEYNGFFPAPLKNAIDFLYAEWENKPIGLVGYGFGGGARAVAALTQLLTNVKANVVGNVGLVFETDLTMAGEVTAGDEKVARLRTLADELEAATAEDEIAA